MTDEEFALAPDHEKAWRAYLRSHALLVRRLDADLRAEGLTLALYDALVQLSEAPDRQLYMKDLAHALVYSTSGVTRVVDGLERSGYVQRRTDPNNRRATLVALTATGMSVLERAWPIHARGVDEHFAAQMSASQAATLARVFRGISADLETDR